MKKVYLFAFLLMLVFTHNRLIAQDYTRFDTISTYDVNLTDYLTTNGRVYLANGKVISKEKHDFYKSNWERLQNCQPCEVYTYNEHDQLKHVAIQFGECLVGPFREYYSDGKVKVEGNFKSNTGNDWSTSLRLRGLCSVREGVWNYYSPQGKLESVETYQNGKMVNREEVKDKSESNALNKVRNIFKKSAE